MLTILCVVISDCNLFYKNLKNQKSKKKLLDFNQSSCHFINLLR